MALQQSLADLDRAYRNYFLDLQRVKAQGHEASKPAAGSQASVQVPPPASGGQVYPEQPLQGAGGRPPIAAEGWGGLKVRWSRSLPAAPSSVTITPDRAGRYHASFVVEVAEAPLAPAETAVGIDLGPTSSPLRCRTAGVDNPQWLRQREREAAPVPAQPEPQAQGQPERDKARLRTARLHARVADARRDFHHQLSTNVIVSTRRSAGDAQRRRPRGRSRFRAGRSMTPVASSPPCWSTSQPGGAGVTLACGRPQVPVEPTVLGVWPP